MHFFSQLFCISFATSLLRLLLPSNKHLLNTNVGNRIQECKVLVVVVGVQWNNKAETTASVHSTWKKNGATECQGDGISLGYGQSVDRSVSKYAHKCKHINIDREESHECLGDDPLCQNENGIVSIIVVMYLDCQTGMRIEIVICVCKCTILFLKYKYRNMMAVNSTIQFKR